MYVDRLDAAAGGGGGGSAGGGAGAELAVMQSLTAALGPGLWLNTILAFTHAGGRGGRGAGGAGHSRNQARHDWVGADGVG